jgi:DNA-binding response OmpR family regulator
LAGAPESSDGGTVATERKKRKVVAKPRQKTEKAQGAEVDPEENRLDASDNVTHLNGKWVRFIADLLEKQGRVIAADDIVSEAIYRYDIADEKHQTTRQVIYNTLYKLDSTKRMIGSCTIPGRKGKRYGLKKWFTPDGEIRAPFLAKAT